MLISCGVFWKQSQQREKEVEEVQRDIIGAVNKVKPSCSGMDSARFDPITNSPQTTHHSTGSTPMRSLN